MKLELLEERCGQTGMDMRTRNQRSSYSVLRSTKVAYILPNQQSQRSCCPQRLHGRLAWGQHQEAAIREVYEETGVKLESATFWGINDKPTENHQNVTFRYYSILGNSQFKNLNIDSNTKEIIIQFNSLFLSNFIIYSFTNINLNLPSSSLLFCVISVSDVFKSNTPKILFVEEYFILFTISFSFGEPPA